MNLSSLFSGQNFPNSGELISQPVPKKVKKVLVQTIIEGNIVYFTDVCFGHCQLLLTFNSKIKFLCDRLSFFFFLWLTITKLARHGQNPHCESYGSKIDFGQFQVKKFLKQNLITLLRIIMKTIYILIESLQIGSKIVLGQLKKYYFKFLGR